MMMTATTGASTVEGAVPAAQATALKASSTTTTNELANASAVDIVMAFFKYILCDFNTKQDVASLRFGPRDLDARRRCCTREDEKWVCADPLCCLPACVQCVVRAMRGACNAWCVQCVVRQRVVRQCQASAFNPTVVREWH